MMGLASILLAFTYIHILQVTVGQQFKMGGVEPSKLASSQQPFQKRNTESLIIAKSIDNIGQTQNSVQNANLNSDMDNKQSNFNKSVSNPNEARIISTKFVRNEAHDVPVSSLAMINRNSLASQPPLGHPASATITPNFPNFANFVANTDQGILIQGNTGAGQMINKQVEKEAGSVSNSQLYITLRSQSPVITPSQPLLQSSAQSKLPSLQFVPNIVSLQDVASPSHQPFSSLQIQPLNVQSEAKYKYTPPPAVSTQKATDDTIQSRHSLTSLLLSHLLSQSCKVQDPPTPIMNPSYRDYKPFNIKTLLPLLLNLLDERNKNCCECGNFRIYNGSKKRKMDDGFEDSLEMNSEVTLELTDNARERDRHANVNESSAEEEDYSDESSDYSAENYD